MGWTGRKEGSKDTGWMKGVPLYIIAGASSARVSFLLPFVLQLHKHVCRYTVGYAVNTVEYAVTQVGYASYT